MENVLLIVIYYLYKTFIAAKELDWSNKSLVQKYKYYMACISNYETHIKRLERNFTQLELSILSEIQAKKNQLSKMDENNLYSNTIPDNIDNKFHFITNWYIIFIYNCLFVVIIIIKIVIQEI